MIESQNVLRRALNLTLAIYRLTRLLPGEEPIGWQIRKLANEIIGDLALANFKIVQKRIELLFLFFEIAQMQDWVKPANWQVLKKEYAELNQEILYLELAGESSKELSKKEKVKEEENLAPAQDMSHNVKKERKIRKDSAKRLAKMGQRQTEVLEEIRNKESIKFSDLISLFKDKVSGKTLRKDLKVLAEKDLIKKKGTNRNMVYYIIA